MLSFTVISQGKPVPKPHLAGAYVVGSDDVPLRAEITSEPGLIVCKKRAAGPAGLALLWEVDGVGHVMVDTIRLQEREKPYVLQVELARGRLARLSAKIEDWGLHDYPPAAEGLAKMDEAKELLIKALQADKPAEIASLGDESLAAAVAASESLAKLHAELFADRRKQSSGFSQRVLGCEVALDQPTDLGGRNVFGAFDFITLPVSWRAIEPAEQAFEWKTLDTWMEFLTKRKVPIHAAPLLCFRDGTVPDWLYIWEHDFDTVRDLAFDHVRRVINRYAQHVQSWTVVSGLHAENSFSFNFEQIMELTRMACALTRQLSPRGTTIIELVSPWGEYYARNQRTIPPLLYADMAVQSGIAFDAFGIQVCFGPSIDGMFTRDMFQISAMLDQFSKLGKPVHITAVQVPSAMDAVKVDAGNGSVVTRAVDGGVWHEPWSEASQAEWVAAFADVALSKPFVESICWRSLADHPAQPVPHGGLLGPDHNPKKAYDRWVNLRRERVGRRQ